MWQMRKIFKRIQTYFRHPDTKSKRTWLLKYLAKSLLGHRSPAQIHFHTSTLLTKTEHFQEIHSGDDCRKETHPHGSVHRSNVQTVVQSHAARKWSQISCASACICTKVQLLTNNRQRTLRADAANTSILHVLSLFTPTVDVN